MAASVFLFAPGAGAPSSHRWMERWKAYLQHIGPVQSFDYPYMRESRRRPDPLQQLITAHRNALSDLRSKAGGARIILAGKSMGARIGCHLSLQEKVAGLVCLGYPLCGGGDRAKLRDKVLRELTTPILFVQGSRDPLCPLDLLQSVREEMTASNFLHLVDGGDHSLLVTKAALKVNQQTQEEIDRKILQAIATFVAGLSD